MGDQDLQKALDYYKRKTNELAGENVRLDIQISDMKLELSQKRRVLELLSTLQRALGGQLDPRRIVETCVTRINSVIGMDKTIFLEPAGDGSVFKPTLHLGFAESDHERMKTLTLTVPEEIASGQKSSVVHAQTQRSEFEQTVAAMLELPHFIVVGVPGSGGPLGVLISGRMTERMPHYPALNEGDANSFQSIATWISTTIENMTLGTLKELDRLKTDFFANISHEFRTPITLTIGPLESLLSGTFGPISPQMKSVVEVMLRNQRRLLNLINEILDLAKLEAGAMKLNVSAVHDIRGFVKSIFDPFIPYANEQRGLEMKFTAAKDLQGR